MSSGPADSLPENTSLGTCVRPVNDRSSVLKLSSSSSATRMTTFFGLLSSAGLFLADSRLDCMETADLADVTDFLL
mgnify:CR=1 FL=1